MPRIFFKVGSGLFTAETVGEVTTIYDCGGQNVKLVEGALDRLSRKLGHNIIKAVFISHYDRDHINGISYVLKHFQVEYLFLPLVDNVTRFISYLRSPYLNSDLYDFYKDPKSFVARRSERTKVVFVLNGEQALCDESFPREINKRGIAFSFVENLEWLYKPYNSYVMNSCEVRYFLYLLGLPFSAPFSDIKSQWDIISRELKQAILKVLPFIKDINDYSMTLWTGPCHYYHCGCLYTGDYNAFRYMNELKWFYSSELPYSDIIQIPHHGSILNFHNDLMNGKAVYVISAKSAPYRSRQHPNPNKVINKLQNNNSIVHNTFGNDVWL